MRRNSSKIEPALGRVAAPPSTRAGGSRAARRVAVDEVVRGRASSSSSGSAKPARCALRERVGDERAQLPREHLGLARLRVDRARSRRSSRRRRPRGRSRRRPGSSSGACRGTRRACRRTTASVPGRELLLAPRLVEERDVEQRRAVVHDDLDERAALARAPAARPAAPRRTPSPPRRPASVGDLGALRAVDPAARVVLRAGRARCRCPCRRAAPRASAPTPFEPRQLDRRAGPRSVSGGSPAGTRARLLDADEVRVERLAAVVELDLDVRERELEVLADALRSRPRGASAPTSTVTISLSSSTSVAEQLARPRRPATSTAATIPSRVSAIQSPCGDRAALGRPRRAPPA